MELLHNRYEIIKRLSDTCVFEVYLAKDTQSDINVSVYKVKNAFMQDEGFVNGLTQGIIDCRDLNHPNTLRFIDVDADPENDSLIFVYEYADGVSLKEVFARQAKLPLQKSIEIAINVLHSLDNAHLIGICHGDLYSDDIFVTQDGHVKVRGYGRKDGIEISSIAKEHLSLETIKYQSPEVLESMGLYESSDVYSVGIILYQMLTGKVPFDGNTSVEVATKILRDAPLSPRMINRDLSASLSSLILESINKEYNARVGTASLFVSRLTDVLRGYKHGEYSAPHENVAIKNESVNEKKSMVPLLITLFVIVCFFATLITVLSVNSQKMQMPNLVGLSEDDAISKLQGLKLHYIKGEEKFSSDYGAGIVCEQSPKAGDKIGKKEKVEYYLSKGVEEVKMPYIIGLDYETAKEKLSMGNFTIEIREEYSNSVPDGTVLSTIPDSGVTLENGAPVTVTISKGSHSGMATNSSGTTSDRINYGNSEDENFGDTNIDEVPDYEEPSQSHRTKRSQRRHSVKKTYDTPDEVEKEVKKTEPEPEKKEPEKVAPKPEKTEKPAKSESKSGNTERHSGGYASSGSSSSSSSSPDATVEFN